jgi:hypothetical protein
MTQATWEAHGSSAGSFHKATQRESHCTPVVRLCLRHFTVNRGDALSPRYEDVELPVIALAFAYGTRLFEASTSCVTTTSGRSPV